MTNVIKSDILVDVEFKYSLDGKWYKTEITMSEWCEILHSGEIEGKQIARIKLCTVSADEQNAELLYDFVAKNIGHNPWGIA